MDFSKAIPDYLRAAFNRAYSLPRVKLDYRRWNNVEESIRAVSSGEKPMTYGFPRGDKCIVQAQSLGLEIILQHGDSLYPNNIHTAVFRPEDLDFMLLMGWAFKREARDATRHYVIGILMGYPIDAVLKFVEDAIAMGHYSYSED